MSKRLPCPEWEERLALKLEELSPADRSALEAHLLTCSGCQATRQSYASLVTHLQNLPTSSIQPLPRLRNLWEQENEQEKSPPLFPRAQSQGTHRFGTLLAPLGIAAVIFLVLSLAHHSRKRDGGRKRTSVLRYRMKGLSQHGHVPRSNQEGFGKRASV
jgi:hypothetical protein